MVTFKVPFLSSRAEVLGGSLQTCSCEGSWEHGGYICLALPDVCYVTYMDKVSRFRVRVRVVSVRARALGLGLTSQTYVTPVFDASHLVNPGISCQRGKCERWHAIYSPGK